VGLAQPRITAFAADAQLRTIVGARIASDGRAFANVGSWTWAINTPDGNVLVLFDGSVARRQ
jgi:hypothetical protein